jgi:hypothetical protein
VLIGHYQNIQPAKQQSALLQQLEIMYYLRWGFFFGFFWGGSNSLIYPHFSFMPFVNFDIKKNRTSHVRKSLCLHTKDDY